MMVPVFQWEALLELLYRKALVIEALAIEAIALTLLAVKNEKKRAQGILRSSRRCRFCR